MRPLILLLLALGTTVAPAQTRTASVIGHCQSLLLRSVTNYTSSGFPADLHFTTFDGNTATPPLRQTITGGFLYSGELRPRGGGDYEMDYAIIKDADASFLSYGSVVLNLPTTDLDTNGLPDLAQFDKAGTVALAGTYTQNSPVSATISVNGSLARAAGALTGLYNIVGVGAGGSQIDITGGLELQRYTGSISYTHGASSTLTFACQRTNAGVVFNLSGTTTFTVVSPNQFTLPSFTLTNSTDSSVYTVQAATFNRAGNRYVGALTFADGDTRTAWADHPNWVFEFTDLNDLNGNGIPDLSDISPWFTSSTTSLPAIVTDAIDAYPIDFDSDGDLDLLVMQLKAPTFPATTVKLIALRNNGNGQFTDATAEVLGDVQTVHIRDVRVADFNGDGRMDVLLADHGTDTAPFPGGQTRILIQTADGKLRDETATRLPIIDAFTHHISVGDIDGDGDLDIYMCNIYNQAQVGPRLYLNNGQGFFTANTNRLPVSLTTLQRKFTASAFVDVDGDGDFDLVLGFHDPVNSAAPKDRDAILLNDGTGNFTFAPDTAMPLRYASDQWETIAIAPGDFDGDGRPDLIMVVTLGYRQPYLQLLLNNGNGTFRDATGQIPQSWPAPTATFSTNWVSWVRTADFNNDGRLDFVCTIFGAPPKLFLNMGGAQFVEASELLPSAPTQTVLAGDFTADGRADVFVLGQNRTYTFASNLLSVAVSPAITVQPQNQTIAPGGSVTFSVVATGTGPLSYQWRLNGTNVPNATGPTLTLGNVQTANLGTYTLFITNATGNATSAPAKLSLLTLQMYAGLTLEGPVGTVYRIDYTTNLNAPFTWTVLTTVALTASPQDYVDFSSKGQPKRFYRAVAQ